MKRSKYQKIPLHVREEEKLKKKAKKYLVWSGISGAGTLLSLFLVSEISPWFWILAGILFLLAVYLHVKHDNFEKEL